jgi:NAD(P)-dependent dehydrogenase (short-subunit alcohol dehydrogenase family)
VADYGIAGKRIAVTGAASGIGQAVAQRVLAERATVVAVDINADGLRPVAEAGAEVVVADLATAEGRQQTIERVAHFDALINAAGVIRIVPPSEVSEDDWDRVFGLNARGLFFMCQAFARTVPDGGRIVNLSSVSARNQSTLETAVYAASKAAVVAITRTFAHLLGPRNVCVNAILPGIIDTPMQEKVLAEIAPLRGSSVDELARERLKIVPFARPASAAECAEFIVSLLGPSGDYVTGQALAVDGGYTMV